MAVYYVFQGETYSEERTGGYVWSPKLTKDGRKNSGYENMKDIHEGDFILHNNNGEVVAISVARSDCFSAEQPAELKNAQKDIEWNDDGYKINLDYYEFEFPLQITNYQDFLARTYSEDSAFDRRGIGKSQYMCHLSNIHAGFILTQAARIEEYGAPRDMLYMALSYLKFSLDENEYDKSEIEEILQLVRKRSENDKPEWKFKRKPTDFLEIDKYLYHRKLDLQAATDALTKAEYKCEVDPSHKTFTSISGKPYTEAYHLIPLNRWYNFDSSLDVMENIVSLCPHCHSALLYGDKYSILRTLWDKREEVLSKCGIKLSMEEFFAYYGMAVNVIV